MRNKFIIIFMAVCIGFSLNSSVLAKFDQLDDMSSSFKDLERSLKQDSLKSQQIQKDYELPRQINQPGQQDLILPPQQHNLPSLQDSIYNDKPATDRAMLKNQEIYEEFMGQQKRRIKESLEQAEFRIPKKYRFVIELFVIALCITIFGLMFFKKKVKKEEEEKVTDDDEGPDDGIVFYDVK